MTLRRDQVTSDEPAGLQVADRRTVEATSMWWSPAQIVGLLAGIGFSALGIAALAKTGFNTAHLYRPQVLVWGLPHSPLLGALELAFGIVVVLVSVVPGAERGPLIVLGTFALVIGIVVLTESVPNRLNHWLGVTHRNGWLFVIAGAVLVVTALFAPTFAARRRIVTDRENVVPSRV